MKQLTLSNGQTDGQLELPYTSTWDEYADWVVKATDPRAFKRNGLIYALSGLATEGGECGAYVEKYLRKDGEYAVPIEEVLQELGDIYYYFTLACAYTGYSPEQIAAKNVAKLTDRKINGKK